MTKELTGNKRKTYTCCTKFHQSRISLAFQREKDNLLANKYLNQRHLGPDEDLTASSTHLHMETTARSNADMKLVHTFKQSSKRHPVTNSIYLKLEKTSIFWLKSYWTGDLMWPKYLLSTSECHTSPKSLGKSWNILAPQRSLEWACWNKTFHTSSICFIRFHSSDGFALSPPLDGSPYDERLDEPPEFVPKMLSELSVKEMTLQPQ